MFGTDQGAAVSEHTRIEAESKRERHERLVAEANAKARDIWLSQLQETGKCGLMPGLSLAQLVEMIDTLGIDHTRVEFWASGKVIVDRA